MEVRRDPRTPAVRTGLACTCQRRGIAGGSAWATRTQEYGLKPDQLEAILFRDKKDQKEDRIQLFWQRIGASQPRPASRLPAPQAYPASVGNQCGRRVAAGASAAVGVRTPAAPVPPTKLPWPVLSRGGRAPACVRSAWPTCPRRERTTDNERPVHCCATPPPPLSSLVMEEGRKWQSISKKMGRMASNCRDRYREISVKQKNSGTRVHKRGRAGRGAQIGTGASTQRRRRARAHNDEGRDGCAKREGRDHTSRKGGKGAQRGTGGTDAQKRNRRQQRVCRNGIRCDPLSVAPRVPSPHVPP